MPSFEKGVGFIFFPNLSNVREHQPPCPIPFISAFPKDICPVVMVMLLNGPNCFAID